MRHRYSVFLVFSILLVSCTGPTAAVSSSGNSVSSSVTSSQPGSSSPGMSSQSTPSTVVLPSSTTPPSSTTVPPDYIPVPPDYFTNRHYREDEDLKTSTVEWAPIPAQVEVFDGFEAYVAGTRFPLYSVQVNTEHVFYPNNYKRTAAAVGILRLVGRAFFQIRCPFPIESVSVKPVGAGISSTIDTVYNVLGFELTSAGQYTVEINGPTEHVLHLFVDGPADQYDDYKGAETIYFEPGLHDRSNDDRINANDEIILHSGQTLFIDYGAVVRAKIVSDYSTGVKVVGGGVIDGSLFDRDAEKNTRAIPFDFNFCTDFLLKGVTFLDPAGWCLNIYFCSDVTVENVKIITSRANGDGISLQSVQRARVRRCFVRSFDDSIVVKNYPQWSDRNLEGATRDIKVEFCTLWTDLAQSLEIGYECVGAVMEDISFSDISVIHNFHKPVISIHNSNNAEIDRVTYERITVDDPSMGQGDGYRTLIEINAKYSPTWSNVQKTTALGSVSNVRITDLLVRGTESAFPIRIEGSLETRSGFEQSTHYVKGVYLTDISIGGKKINSRYQSLIKNEYVKSIFISERENTVVKGAEVYTDLPADQLAAYGRNVTVVNGL